MVILSLGQPQPGENAAHMLFDRSLSNPQLVRDARVGSTLGQERQHVPFTACEVLDCVITAAR